MTDRDRFQLAMLCAQHALELAELTARNCEQVQELIAREVGCTLTEIGAEAALTEVLKGTNAIRARLVALEAA